MTLQLIVPGATEPIVYVAGEVQVADVLDTVGVTMGRVGGAHFEVSSTKNVQNRAAVGCSSPRRCA